MMVNCFSTYETTARDLLRENPIDRLHPADPPAAVHVVVIGYTDMGKAVVEQALRLGHFRPPTELRVTILDAKPGEAEAALQTAYPCLKPEALDGEDEPTRAFRGDLLPRVRVLPLPESDRDLLGEASPVSAAVGPGIVTSAYVCIDDGMDSAACVAALAPRLDFLAATQGADVEMFYYYNFPQDEHKTVLEDSLRDATKNVRVVAFDNFLEQCSVPAVEAKPLDNLAREIAAFYERQYGSGEDASLSPEDRARYFELAWQRLTESDRESNRQAADHIPVKLRAIGARIRNLKPGESPAFAFRREDPDEMQILARLEHRRWCAERFLDGWMSLPRTPENEALWARHKRELKQQKRHIDLQPYDELPEAERGKDFSQIEGIPSFLAATGKAIERVPSPSE